MYFEHQILNAKAHQEYDIGPMNAQDLQSQGYYVSTGLPVGQMADYRKAMPDRRGIHVRQYPNGRWTAHWDRVDPSVDFVAHMVQDAPVAGVVLLGLAIIGLGAWAGRSGFKASL